MLCNYYEIIELYQKIAPLVKDLSVLNEIHDYVGDAYRLTGHFDKAYEFYHRVIESVKEKDRIQKCFFPMYNYLDLKYVQGYIQEAKSNIEQILAKLEPEAGLYKLCYANRLLGNIVYQSGENDKARDYYKTTYEYAKASNRPLTQAETLESIAKTYVGMDNEEAMRLNGQARDIAERYRFNRIYAKTYYPEATVYLDEERYGEALECALIGEKLNKDINYLTGTARMRRYVARAYLGLGEYEKAIEYATMSVNGYKTNASYPISRMKSYIVLLQAAKALGKTKEYASVDSLDDIYYQEFPNADQYIQTIQALLSDDGN